MGKILDIAAGTLDMGMHPVLNQFDKQKMIVAAGDAAMEKLEETDRKYIRQCVKDLTGDRLKVRAFGRYSAIEVLTVVAIFLAECDKEEK